MKLRWLLAGLVTIGLALPAAAIAQEETQFWSLLGVGQGGTVNAADLAENVVTGEPPASFVNQRELFENLLYAAPNVRTGELGSFFKPAELGVAPSDVTAEESPRPGVRIVRDGYAVPHVYGETRADTMWGAGWVAAEDRLFFMDVLRHTARGELTELVGPGPNGETLADDAAQLLVTDYREEDLHAMIDGVRASGAAGAAAIADLDEYVEGVNAYIAAAGSDPLLLPAEYPALGLSPQPWKATDTAAIAGLLNGYFGIGGGAGMEVAEVISAARKRFGASAASEVVADFRNRDEPEAPVTTTRRFEFDDPGPVRRRAVAMPRAATIELADPTAGTGVTASASSAAAPDWLESLRERGLGLSQHASNAIAIPAARSASGHPLLVAGPQVDFYSPEIFYEQELHGPGIEARGVGLPGAGPFVIVGHGDDYAWSITTAQGDNTDVFAERLCEPDGARPTLDSTHYRYRGQCVAMLEQDRRLDYVPPPTDPGLPQSFDLHLERSVHGPIIGRAMVGRRPAAFSLARASYMHDADVVLGFARLNDPAAIDNAASFQRAAAPITGSFNFFYVDSKRAAYIQSGIYPRRAKGTSPDLPNWGTGRWEWRGFEPDGYTADYLGFARLPQDVDPKRGYLVSWNNRQAPGWRASDADWQYGSVHRSQRLERRVRRALRAGGKIGLGQLVGIMGDAATVDVRGEEVYPWLRRVIGRPRGELGQALRILDTWARFGAHRRDLDRDNVYDESAAVALMDAWWDPMAHAVFEPALGGDLFDKIATINPVDYKPSDGPDTWYYGWMSYVQKDMRALLGRRIASPPSRIYCGDGSVAKCRRLLRRSLREAVSDVKAQYGSLDAVVPATCPVTEPPTCDQLDFITAGAIETPPTPWQDRGTFQQAVEIR